jgi:hypothetical protein
MARIRSLGYAFWYLRCDRIASYTSEIEQRIVHRFSASRLTPFGYPVPSRRRWCSKATIGEIGGTSGVRRRISAPSTTCRFMIANSSSVSFAGLLRISAGVRTLPMSCISPAMPNSRSSGPSIPRARACAIVRIDTFTMCVNV